MAFQILDNVFYLVSGNLNNNTYVLISNYDAVIVDPSFSYQELKEFLKAKKINNIAILITHFHYDHIGYSYKLLNDFPAAKLYIGKEEQNHAHQTYATYFDDLLSQYKSQLVFLDEKKDSSLTLYGLTFKLIYTPIHTMGSITYQYKHLFFTGDFIFSSCIGNYNSYYHANGDEMFQKSIRILMQHLHDDDLICAGHDAIEPWKTVVKINDELHEFGKIEWKSDKK